MLWDGGFDFALISYMDWEEVGRPIDYMKMNASAEPQERPPGPDPWHNVLSTLISSQARSMTPRWANTPDLFTPDYMGNRVEECDSMQS
jgi:hypothetical protein